MRKLLMLLLLGAALWYLMLGGGLESYERYRVQGALVELGLSQNRADCMARRMVDRLSHRQLWNLRRFSKETRSLEAYISGLQRAGDSEVLAVTVSSAALCASGLAS